MTNFAHGEVFMIGAYIGWGVLVTLLSQAVGGLHPIWVLPVMLLPAMVLCGGLGMALERFAYRPLYVRGATRLGPLISAVGASIFLQNAVMLTQGARMKVYMTNLYPALALQHLRPQRSVPDRHGLGLVLLWALISSSAPP
jgi:branched-chain amino acid transport system permease protein